MEAEAEGVGRKKTVGRRGVQVRMGEEMRKSEKEGDREGVGIGDRATKAEE